jgi:hypothetical protein
MAQLLGPEVTSFTLDNMGRNLCNTLQEALDSLNAPVAGNQQGFDVIVIGGRNIRGHHRRGAVRARCDPKPAHPGA